jgi:hypothetical protein
MTDGAIFCGGGPGDRNGYRCCGLCVNNQHFHVFRRQDDRAGNGRRHVVATYDYTDERGQLLYQTIRYVPKDFSQRRPDGRGDWIWNLQGVRRVLYRLPELLAAPLTEPVFVVEGEQDADRLRQQGLTATTSAMGAQAKWRPEYNEVLHGRRVVLLPDNDAPGRQHMEDVQRNLEGVALSVVVLTLPDLPPKGDVSDWLDAGGTRHALLEMVAALPAQERCARNPQKPQRKRGFGIRPSYRPFPQGGLASVLGDYVGAAAAAIGCDPSLVALPALAVAAAGIGNSRVIRLKRGWTEPSVIWAATIAPSGEMKSPGWEAASRPYAAIQMELVDLAEARREKWEAEMETWRADRAAAEKPKRPPDVLTLVTTDTTVWTLGERLRNNPRGILLSRDELDGWFQGLTRFAGNQATDRPHWLELHRAGTLLIDRMSRDKGKLAVRRASCSLCGTIQPAILARGLDDDSLAAGLGARLLMASPPKTKKRWTEAEVCEELVGQYDRLLRNLLALKLQDEARREPHVLDMDRDAKTVWVEWYNHWGDRQFNSQAEQAAVLAKLEAYAARLALIHHVVRHVGNGLDALQPIRKESLLAGICLAEWFAEEALRIYQNLRLTKEQQEQSDLREWIDQHGGEMTARQLRDSCRNRYPKTEDAEEALGALVEAGLGEWLERPAGPQGGRPTRAFRSSQNPKTPETCGENEVLGFWDGVTEKGNDREPGAEG